MNPGRPADIAGFYSDGFSLVGLLELSDTPRDIGQATCGSA